MLNIAWLLILTVESLTLNHNRSRFSSQRKRCAHEKEPCMQYKQTGEIQRAVVVVDTVNPESSVLKTETPTSAKMEIVESEKKGIQAGKAGTETAVISILLVDDHAL